MGSEINPLDSLILATLELARLSIISDLAFK